MADLLLPPWVRISGGRYDFLSNTAASSSIFTGATRSVGRTGDRVKVSINTQNASHREDAPSRALLEAIRAQLRGQANRIWYTDPGYSCRGSFPDGELLTNNTFGSGTTGWAGDTQISVSSADRVLRALRSAVTTAGSVTPSASSTVVQYAPYVMRYAVMEGRGAFSSFRIDDGSSTLTGTSFTTYGLTSQITTPLSTTAIPQLIDLSTSGVVAGEYFSIPYVSLSRCALVDNGPNDLQNQQSFNLSPWSVTGVTVTADGANAPDNMATADVLVEDGATSDHNIAQISTMSAVAHDRTAWCCIKANGRNFAYLQMTHAGGSVTQFFNLSTGATATGSTGTGWSNLRPFIVPLGNSWYFCAIVARKSGAQTTLTTWVGAASADTTASYAGSSGNALSIWSGGTAASSVPVRAFNTGSNQPTGAVQTGPGYHTKGWPASTNGLLLYGDWVQIGNQLNKVVAPVNSDAAGLAYLQLAYPMRTAPSDNDPVIITNPFGRMILTSNEGGYDFAPEGSNHDFDLVEALDQ